MKTKSAIESVHMTDRAHSRLRARYRSESWFKFCGLLAVVIAMSALFTLLYTVVGKAMGAMTETYITLPVTLEKSAYDPDGTGDPKVIRKGDFTGAIKAALREQYPSVKGRKEKIALYKLISDGAALELRKAAMEDPSLIGKTVNFRALASDDADLYVKGYEGTIVELPHPGTATPVGTKGDVEVSVESNAFQSTLQIIKDSLGEEAERVRRQAKREQRGIAVFTRRLEALGAQASVDEREALESRIAGYKLRRDNLIKKAEDLESRVKASGGTETLTSDLPSFFVQINDGVIKLKEVSTRKAKGQAILPLSSENSAPAGNWKLLRMTQSEAGRRIKDTQVVLMEGLKEQGKVETTFNWRFFTASDSREAEQAGVWGSMAGSFWTMLVTFLLSFPVGVLAAIYLEQFAPKNRFTDFIEVNINNLAAVPSIVFGLLGLAVFISFFGMPRSAPLVGGIVLALMTLPTIIIASRAALKAVPSSIQEAALGVGASKQQAVFHHVLPLAMPGILTGTIIGMAQALGETAPLLLIGMVAFIKDIPMGVTEPASVLPVQIFRWSDFPERAFEMRTAAAIMVLLGFLVIMNAVAILLRKRFERRW